MARILGYSTRRIPLIPISILILCLATASVANPQTTIYSQDWEDGFGSWFPSAGVWEVGVPTAGTEAYQGQCCAATVLAGNYPYATNSRLQSPLIELPAAPADGALWLGFWHFFNNSGSDGLDYGVVQIWTEADDWQDVSVAYYRYSSVWTPYYVDLAAFAGQTIRIGFRFQDVDGGGYGHNEAPGWYVDLVRIFDGAFAPLPNPVSFEGRLEFDWEGWYADQGVWEIGQPCNGCNAALSGQRVAGTVLAGNYYYAANSRLISPPVDLPASPLDGQLYFTYEEWCNLSSSDGSDYVVVEIDDGSGWAAISAEKSYYLNHWSEQVLDISTFAGQTVRFAFRITDVDGGGYGHNEGPGWFLDDLAITEGNPFFSNPADCENECPSWTSWPCGTWQVGVPGAGPGAAHSGEYCWGTYLDSNYPYGSYETLYMPWRDLPASPPEPLVLHFWHWYSISTSDGTDRGVVVVQVEGEEPVEVGGPFYGSSGGWTPYQVDLAAYAGQRVRIGFLMDDNDGGGYGHNEAAGWYLDDIAIAGLPQSQPAEPYFLDMIISSGPAELNWYHPDAEVAHVVVYGSPHQGFRPSLGTRLAILPADAHTYSDTAHPGWPNLFYRVSVVDINGNESLPLLPTTMIATPDTPPADAVVLRGAAPNPFNPTTTIRFRLDQSARVELSVYDLAGRRVADLVREVLPAGDHAVPFAPRHLASGTYVARLVCEGRVMTAKMMLVR